MKSRTFALSVATFAVVGGLAIAPGDDAGHGPLENGWYGNG